MTWLERSGSELRLTQRGHRAPGCAPTPAAGERLLVTLDGRYRTLEGEAFRADVGNVVFTVDESRFDADVEVRYTSPGGWLAATRFGAIREVRRRRDARPRRVKLS